MSRLRSAAVLVSLLLLSGCVGMPTEGPVVERAESDEVDPTPVDGDGEPESGDGVEEDEQ